MHTVLTNCPSCHFVQQQTASAAWPHLIGIFTGHTYHFFSKVWPTLGGRAYLTPPKWVTDKLGGSAGSNVPGVDFRKGSGKSASKGGSTGSLLNRARKVSARKGRKLD
jgi:hypothetical protein